MSWADTGILLATVALCAAAVVCAVVWLGDWAHRRRRKSGGAIR